MTTARSTSLRATVRYFVMAERMGATTVSIAGSHAALVAQPVAVAKTLV